jgi:hypothetical protein
VSFRGNAEEARLIALNMALNGRAREDVDRYLAPFFPEPDRGRILEDVYRRVGR